MLAGDASRRRAAAFAVGLSAALLFQLIRLALYPTGTMLDGPLESAPIVLPVSAAITGLALRELDAVSAAVLLLGTGAGLMLTAGVAALLVG